MTMTYLLNIIARGLAIVDGIMASWTTTPAFVGGNCGTGAVNVTLTACGSDLVAGIEKLVNQAVPLLNALVGALGAMKA
jgi:hypothetical protein